MSPGVSLPVWEKNLLLEAGEIGGFVCISALIAT